MLHFSWQHRCVAKNKTTFRLNRTVSTQAASKQRTNQQTKALMKEDGPCWYRKVDPMSRGIEARRVVESSLVQKGSERVGKNCE